MDTDKEQLKEDLLNVLKEHNVKEDSSAWKLVTQAVDSIPNLINDPAAHAALSGTNPIMPDSVENLGSEEDNTDPTE